MKQCPNCKNTYTDESLQFCLADGTRLVYLSEAEKTIAMNSVNDDTIEISPGTNRMRVDTSGSESPESVSTIITPPRQTQQTERKGVSPIIVGILAVLLLFVLIGFAGFVAYTFLKPDNSNTIVSNSETPEETETPTPNDELANLKKEIANLKELTNNQQNTEKKPVSETPLPTLPPSSGNTARVNSPRDGFLALRSEPDTESGFRVMKIPHNSTVKIIGCRGYSYVGKTRGRWCDVVYTDQRGWVFDAYLRR